MSSLSHDQAREFIQQDYLAEEDRLALRQHLATCDACRLYAAMHVKMMQQLPRRSPRVAPTAAQRAAILGAAGRMTPRFWRPLAATGSVAAVLFLAMTMWLVMRAASPVATQPAVPEAIQTSLAPYLPPAATPDPRGRYVIDTIPAPSLAGNAIGEPLEQQVVVYLPPSYDATNRRYPVVYGLFYTSNNAVSQLDEFGRLVRSGMAIALNNEAAQEMILVIPSAVNALNLMNHFVNSPVVGDWESFLARDLVAYVDANYRTMPDAGSRGLLGQSHMAPAALATAERYPDVFSAVYLSEPWVISPTGIEQSPFFSWTTRRNIVALLDQLATLGPEEARARLIDVGGNDFPNHHVSWWTVSYGVAYVPTDEATPPYFKYPYSDSDGPADPEIWQLWERSLGQVPERIQANLDALRTLDIAISHPTGVTEPALMTPDGPTYLSEQLTAAGIDHRYLVQDKAIIVEVGEDALPFFTEVFANE